MDRKNINRDFKKLRVWQDAVCLYVMACEIFGNFPFEIKKAHPFVWQCHDCHNGVVIPRTYKNIHAEIVTIDPKSLDPNTEVMRF